MAPTLHTKSFYPSSTKESESLLLFHKNNKYVHRNIVKGRVSQEFTFFIKLISLVPLEVPLNGLSFFLVKFSQICLNLKLMSMCSITPSDAFGALMNYPCLFCPSDNLEHHLAHLTPSRISVRALSYWCLLSDPRRCEMNRKVGGPRCVSARAVPHIVYT